MVSGGKSIVYFDRGGRIPVLSIDVGGSWGVGYIVTGLQNVLG